jgi:hypothetical protein
MMTDPSHLTARSTAMSTPISRESDEQWDNDVPDIDGDEDDIDEDAPEELNFDSPNFGSLVDEDDLDADDTQGEDDLKADDDEAVGDDTSGNEDRDDDGLPDFALGEDVESAAPATVVESATQTDENAAALRLLERLSGIKASSSEVDDDELDAELDIEFDEEWE